MIQKLQTSRGTDPRLKFSARLYGRDFKVADKGPGGTATAHITLENMGDCGHRVAPPQIWPTGRHTLGLFAAGEVRTAGGAHLRAPQKIPSKSMGQKEVEITPKTAENQAQTLPRRRPANSGFGQIRRAISGI